MNAKTPGNDLRFYRTACPATLVRRAEPADRPKILTDNRDLKARTVITATLLASVILLGGCAGVVSSSGNTAAPQISIQVSPSSLNFGSLTVGKKISQTVAVSNTGNNAVSVSSASVSGAQFAISGLTMPLSLAAGQSNTFNVWFEPTAAGTYSGSLSVQADNGAAPTQVSLSGTATASPQQISLSTTNLSLGSVKVGATSSGTVTVSNVGGQSLAISLVSISGTPFGVTGISTPATVAPNGSATLTVSFMPTAAGADAGSLTITSNDPQTPSAVVTLSGTGTTTAVAPTITTQPVNQTVTAGQTATFSVVVNGTAPLRCQWQQNGVNIAGATSSSYTTAATTTPQSGTKYDMVVSNSAGSATSTSATLTVNPAPAPAMQVNSSMTFTSTIVGTTSSQGLVVTNIGTATLSITQLNESGAAFSVGSFSSPLNIGAGQQTAITVSFNPIAADSVSGTLSIVSNAPTSPTAVTLSGQGVAATRTLGMSPTIVAFGNVTTGTSTTAQNVTITNTGNANLAISQIALSGAGYSMTGGAAPVTLTPGQNVVLSVDFSPSAAGSVNGSISIVSNASGSPTSVTLTGTGVAPVQHSATLSWTASTSTVAGYNVYRGTVSGGPYTKINSALVSGAGFTDTSVQSGNTYYYVTTAVDADGNESAYSNEVSAAIP